MYLFIICDIQVQHQNQPSQTHVMLNASFYFPKPKARNDLHKSSYHIFDIN